MKTRNCIAAVLEVNDCFDIAETKYRITDVDSNEYGDKVLHVIPADVEEVAEIVLIVPRDVIFKIYR